MSAEQDLKDEIRRIARCREELKAHLQWLRKLRAEMEKQALIVEAETLLGDLQHICEEVMRIKEEKNPHVAGREESR